MYKVVNYTNAFHQFNIIYNYIDKILEECIEFKHIKLTYNMFMFIKKKT